MVNGQSLTIVGVALENFHGTTLGSRPFVFIPLTMRGSMVPGWKGFDNRSSYWLYLFGRLKPGATIEQARRELQAHDPLVVATSILVLALVAFAAGYVPAHRASTVDPIRALRYE